MNVKQLRDIIEKLLSASPNLIGSYIMPNGSMIPAIYVVGRQSVPNEWKINGLEVTMEEFASVSPRVMVGRVQNNKQWTVVLADYATNSSALSQAAERMARRFPDAQFSFRAETDTVYGQYRIRIPDTEILSVHPYL